MNKIISVLLVGLLGFLGCSNSDAGPSAVTVQALGVVAEDGLYVTAIVMDQEGNLRSDVMITINDEPMNIGFFATEDLGMATDRKGVQCGDYQPSYFLNTLDVSEGDTVDLVAKGSQCVTLYTSTVVVPEKITIIEPLGDELSVAGEPVVVRWEGGAPCSHFTVMYYRGSDAEMFSSGAIQGGTEYVMPAHWIDVGWGVILVDGCESDVEGDKLKNASAIDISVKAIKYIEAGEPEQLNNPARGGETSICSDRCNKTYEAIATQCPRSPYVYYEPEPMCIAFAGGHLAGCRGCCDDEP